MKKLHLVRHGETIWHSQNKYAGHTDIELTDSGHSQARALSIWAATVKPYAIYSSDLVRAIETAKPLAEILGLEIIADPRFREVNFGLVEGLSPEEIKEKYPDLWESFISQPADVQMPGGESGKSALERAAKAIDEILDLNENGEVILICHGTLMRLIACDLLGVEINDYRRVFPSVQNTGRISVHIYDSTETPLTGVRAGLLELDKVKFSSPKSIKI